MAASSSVNSRRGQELKRLSGSIYLPSYAANASRSMASSMRRIPSTVVMEVVAPFPSSEGRRGNGIRLSFACEVEPRGAATFKRRSKRGSQDDRGETS
jgi:hypothetical protein